MSPKKLAFNFLPECPFGFVGLSSPLEFLLFNIAVCVATRWEFLAVTRGLPSGNLGRAEGFPCFSCQTESLMVVVLQTGMGSTNTFMAFQAVLNSEEWDLILSSGFAGALVKTSIGTLVFSSHVQVLDDQLAPGPDLFSVPSRIDIFGLAQGTAERLKTPYLEGLMVTVDKMVCESEEKNRIANRTQGLALDMESGTIGELSAKQGISFLIVRTISDLVDESLPLDLNLFRQKSTWSKGIIDLMLHPTKLMHFNRLRKQMHMASMQLERFFREFISQLAWVVTRHSSGRFLGVKE